MLAHKVGQYLAGQRWVLEDCEGPDPWHGHARRALGQQRQEVLGLLQKRGRAIGLRHGRRPSPVRASNCQRGCGMQHVRERPEHLI